MADQRPTQEQLQQRLADLDRLFAHERYNLTREYNQRMIDLEISQRRERERLLATPTRDDDDEASEEA